MVATWLTKLVFAVDYLEVRDPNAFTASEKTLLKHWFWQAADLMRSDTDKKINEMFVNRPAGDYRLTARGKDAAHSRLVYYGGPGVKTLQKRFNNRSARQARFVTLVGLTQNDSMFIQHGKRYVKDALRFTYFPIGAIGDFERWTTAEPGKGWKYACEFTGALLTIAEHTARTGDFELYKYSTTDGALGTEGQHHTGVPKSLHTLVSDLMKYVDHTYKRYATANASEQGDPMRMIDTVNDLNGEERLNDLMLVMGNQYRNNEYIKKVYMRQAPGSPAYPRVVNKGSGDPEGGEAGTYPGALLMFGNTGSTVWPYPTP